MLCGLHREHVLNRIILGASVEWRFFLYYFAIDWIVKISPLRQDDSLYEILSLFEILKLKLIIDM